MKTCFKCGETKLLVEFYRHKATADGHLNKCKECTKADVRSYRGDNKDKIAEYEYERSKRPDRRLYAAEQGRRHRSENPQKYKARTAVGNAVRDGRLVRKPCESCGSRKSEAHHDDYSRPLDVRWLCKPCHVHAHKEAA